MSNENRYAHRWQSRAAALAIGLIAVAPGAARGADVGTATPTLTRVRFQMRTECQCASCGFELQARLGKLEGVRQVAVAPRERIVSVTFDEGRLPVSRLAMYLRTCELGERSALIGEVSDRRRLPEAKALAHVAGVGVVEVDAKRGRLLVELTNEPPLTTRALATALAQPGMELRFDVGSGKP